MMKKYMKPEMKETLTEPSTMIAESAPIGSGTVDAPDIEGKYRSDKDDKNDAWSNGLW